MSDTPTSDVPLSQYTIVDAHKCDLERLSSLPANKDFAGELCRALEAETSGELLIANFGGSPDPDPRIHGPSFAQMLNRGLVQGHCPTHSRLACIDVLKEGNFDPGKIEKLVKEFYKAEFAQTLTIMRGVPDAIADVNNVYDTSRPDTQWTQVERPRPPIKTSMSTVDINNAFEKHGSWGQFTYIDLFNCDQDKIDDPNHIANYFAELCVAIGAAPYGEPITGDFNRTPETTGRSFAQLIETSLVQGCFLENLQRGMIDIFSCRQFHAKWISDYTAKYFGANEYSTATVLRGCAEQFPVIFHNRVSTKADIQWALEPSRKGE